MTTTPTPHPLDGVGYQALRMMAVTEDMNGRTYAWGRPAGEPCERGTVGCSIRHTETASRGHRTLDDGPCETW